MTRARAAILLVLLALGASAVFEFQLCPFAWLTGIPCPGCGLGRATLALATGHVRHALRLHPLSPLALLVAAFAAIRIARPGAASWPGTERFVACGAATSLAAFVVVWAVRFTGALGGPAPVQSIWSDEPRASLQDR